MTPTTNDISRALKSIESTERGDEHPRTLARKAIEKWRSDAEQERLPITNIHDDKGAPVLNPDATLKWGPRHLGRK